METPRGETDWLSEYLEAHNLVGSSMADRWYDSSAGAVRPPGYNYDSSGARFDGGSQYLGEVRVNPNPNPNLSTVGLKIYEVEEEFSNEEDDMFSKFDEEG